MLLFHLLPLEAVECGICECVCVCMCLFFIGCCDNNVCMFECIQKAMSLVFGEYRTESDDLVEGGWGRWLCYSRGDNASAPWGRCCG